MTHEAHGLASHMQQIAAGRARENMLYTHYLNLRMALESLIGGPGKVEGRETVVYPIAEIIDKHTADMKACGYGDLFGNK